MKSRLNERRREKVHRWTLRSPSGAQQPLHFIAHLAVASVAFLGNLAQQDQFFLK